MLVGLAMPMNANMRTVLAALLLTIGLEAAATAQQAPPSQPSLTMVAGNLLRIEDQGRVTVALPTGKGILLVDPLSLDTARALKDVFDTRYPDQPVRHVVYTDHHLERASGAAVFSSTAQIVAHEAFQRERRRSAGRRVAGDPPDGLYRESVNEQVVPPHESFRRTHVVTLGGERIALFHVALHSSDMTVVFFPGQRVLFVGDAVPIGSVPDSVGPAGIGDAVSSLRLLESLAFDQVLTGDGRVGTKADLSRLRAYFEDLAAGVKAGFKKGQSVDAVVDTVTLTQHITFPGVLVGRPRHIAEVFAALPKQRFDLYGAGSIFALQGRSCISVDCSSIGGTTPGVTVGVGYQFGRTQFGAEIGLLNPMTEAGRPTSDFISRHTRCSDRIRRHPFLAGWSFMTVVYASQSRPAFRCCGSRSPERLSAAMLTCIR